MSDRVEGEVIAAIGDTIAEVASRSTYPLNTGILTDEDLSAADRPVRFRYRGPDGVAFQTRTVAINSVATIVTGIETAPQLDYLGSGAVLTLLKDMEARLDAAGWRAQSAEAADGRDELAQQIVETGKPARQTWNAGVYASGETVLTLRLRRLHAAGSDFPDGAYLLNFVWRNDALRQRAEAVADQLRRQDRMPSTEPRRVDAQSYGARVRLMIPD